MIARSPRAPVPRTSAWSATASMASSVNSSSTPSSSKSFWYCLTSALRRLGQDLDQRVPVELADRGDDRQPADELGDQPELQQVLGQHLGEQVAGVALGLACGSSAPKPMPLLADPAAR